MYKTTEKTTFRYIKNSVKKLIYSFHLSTRVLDQIFFSRKTSLMYPPVFLVGAPRSGTTLFYQLLISAFKTAYFPNISNRFYMSPLTAAQLGRWFCPSYRSSFRSRFGFERGCMAPSEAGNIWNRWFPHEGKEGFNYTPTGYLSQKDKQAIYHLIAGIEDIFQAPFFTKNVKMSVRIPALAEIFPEAQFLYIRREPWHAAVSILRIRRQHRLQWWSVMPREIDSFRSLPDLEQVCHQVYWVEKNIESDLEQFFPKSYSKVAYREVCEHPQEVLHSVQQFLESKGIHLSTQDIPENLAFKVSEPQADEWVSREDIEKIKEILSNLYGKSNLI